MKKIILTVALFTATLFAHANYAKFNSNALIVNDYKLTLVDDSLSSNKRIASITDLKEDLKYNYNISFYDVDRIVITNTQGASIIVVDANGHIVTETTDSIDIRVPAGNYKVYSTIKIASKVFTL